MKLAIIFLLDYCFSNVDNLPFRQVIGIYMGSEPVTLTANLFFITIGINGY